MAKSKQSQVGVSPRQLLPGAQTTFARLCERLAHETPPTFVYAELNDLLSALTKDEFVTAVADPPDLELDSERLNYVAAMIEYTAVRLGAPPPDWTYDVPPLDHPVFASELESLRLHLLVNALPPFSRRNLFVDTSIGGRV